MDYLQRLSDDKIAIFLFHGVIAEHRSKIRNYTRKHLAKDYFARVIRNLKQYGSPLSMDQVVWHYAEKKPFPPRAFAITFDDGFENNYSVAAPILADEKIPAMFYVSTNFIENNTMSWIDRIEYCLEFTSQREIKLNWEKLPRNIDSDEKKIEFLTHLRTHVKKDSRIDVDALVTDICRQCHASEVVSSNDPLDLKMNWQQVNDLVNEQLFTVGGHSHRHVVLSFLNQEDLEKEILTSLVLLKQKAGLLARHYSYPEGMSHCYSESVIDELKKRGILCSPTAEDGTNGFETDLFHLKRIMVT